ncbi:lymphocyte antigen 75 [Plakobranchus ocellatus]|uniref:Lymphocyte antigen 75 n=1 Tax=Plakobranchus ocellatus TaxID=259542 RepID=A0AAV3YVK2_9GAST|nr:lymphocyte antigen 75 [Plakobranchus ocellatus]
MINNKGNIKSQKYGILTVYNSVPTWIGLYKEEGGDSWHWLDEHGTPAYTLWWHSFKKGPLFFEECAYIAQRFGSESLWYTDACTATMPYICEKPLDRHDKGANWKDKSFSPLCPIGWIKSPKGDTCLKIYGDSMLPWSKASQLCQLLGGDLVTIDDDTTSYFIQDNITADSNVTFWIGLNRLNAEARWNWLDENKPPTFTNWDDKYPSRPTEKCAAAVKMAGQRTRWRTYSCSHYLTFICEIAKPPDCYHEGSIYRNGTELSLPDACGNPYTCIKSKWIPSSDQCRWSGECLNIDDKRYGRICRKDRAGVPNIFLEEVYTWYRYACFYQEKMYTNGTEHTFFDACGNPHTCVHGRWIPKIYQCRYKETCFDLHRTEPTSRRSCVKTIYGYTMWSHLE